MYRIGPNHKLGDDAIMSVALAPCRAGKVAFFLFLWFVPVWLYEANVLLSMYLEKLMFDHDWNLFFLNYNVTTTYNNT